LKITFWGVRGSIPQPTSQYIKTEKYGGNTTCLSVELEKHTLIFDAGTGINGYGRNCGNRKNFILLFTHFHHDHVQGFPFFLPIFLPNRIVHYYSPMIIKVPLYEVLDSEFDPPFFPYRFENTMSGKIYMTLTQVDSIRFIKAENKKQFLEAFMEAGYEESFLDEKLIEFPDFINAHLIVNKSQHKLPYEVARIDVMENLAHPNSGTYIYKILTDDKSMVFATDIEGKVGGSSKLINFSKDVDFLIHDSQYFPDEYLKYQDFGHSTYEMACDNALRANVKKLFLTHHDPWSDDQKLDLMEKEAQEYMNKIGGNIEVRVAREGMSF
jgi:phosphoribosyl 1,2-cyclic phosphodiesterase